MDRKRTPEARTADSAKFVAANTGLLAAGAAMAALMVIGGVVAIAEAGAEPADTNVAASCALGGSKLDVTIPLNVDDKVDPVAPGGAESVVTKTGMPSLPVEATINKLVVTTPIPDQIATVDRVTFTGGNVKGSYAVSGRNVVVTFTGPVSSKTIVLPTVTADQTLKSDATGTISWRVFSEVDADTNYGTAVCTPKVPGQVVNTTKVTAAPTTTAPGPTSTTTPSTPTTAPAPPTTTRPTPTTVKPRPGATVSGQGSVSAGPGGATGSVGGTVTVTPPSAGLPGVPGVPPVPGAPGLPGVPGGLPTPTLPGGLPTPTLPTTPTLPSVPSVPRTPAPLPSAPAVPVPVPPVPSLPKAPSLPGAGTGLTAGATGSVHVGAF